MQQVQNNCTPKSCGQGADHGVIGVVEGTCGNIRGTNRIQERQKYSTPME